MKNKIEYGKEYTEYQVNRSPIRKMIRKIYLNSIVKKVEGRAIDFGCGIGELLERLPNGSIGFDINPHTVEYCKNKGLKVLLYQYESDHYDFKEIEKGEFQTFILSHVLEHIPNPVEVLKKIISSCRLKSINKIIIVVPGKKGFKFDNTHQHFISKDFFVKNNLLDFDGYSITLMKYFPINLRWIEDVFTYHELQIVFSLKK